MLRPFVVGQSLPAAAERVLSGEAMAMDVDSPTRTAYYFKFGKWLVRPRYLSWFIRRYPNDSPPLRRPFEYVKVVSASKEVVERYPVIRLKASTSKVSLFDLSRNVKRVVWNDSVSYRAAMAAAEHFSKPPSATPPILSKDPRALCAEERLLGTLLEQSDVRLTDVVPILVGLNAASPKDVCPLGRYLTENAPHVDHVSRHLDGSSREALEAVFTRLQSVNGIARGRTVPMVRVHNDLCEGNLVRSNGNVHLIDLDQSFQASMWYDLVYLTCCSEGIGLDEVLGAVEELNGKAGYDEVGRDEVLEWCFLLFFIDSCRYISSHLIQGRTGRVRRRSSTTGYRLKLLSRNLIGEVWSGLSRGGSLGDVEAMRVQVA